MTRNKALRRSRARANAFALLLVIAFALTVKESQALAQAEEGSPQPDQPSVDSPVQPDAATAEEGSDEDTNGGQAHEGQGADGQPNGVQKPSGSVLSSLMEPFDYDARGRKDPFLMPMSEKPLPPGSFHGPVLPLQKFRLDELALMGIIWDVARPRAMIKDPSGKIHVVGPYAKLGSQNGYIAVIREGEIVVIETVEEEGKLLSAPRIVKLSAGEAGAAGASQGIGANQIGH